MHWTSKATFPGRLIAILFALATALTAQGNWSVSNSNNTAQIVANNIAASNVTVHNDASSTANVQIKVVSPSGAVKSTTTVLPGQAGTVGVPKGYKVFIVYASSATGTSSGTYVNTFPPA